MDTSTGATDMSATCRYLGRDVPLVNFSEKFGSRASTIAVVRLINTCCMLTLHCESLCTGLVCFVLPVALVLSPVLATLSVLSTARCAHVSAAFSAVWLFRLHTIGRHLSDARYMQVMVLMPLANLAATLVSCSLTGWPWTVWASGGVVFICFCFFASVDAPTPSARVVDRGQVSPLGLHVATLCSCSSSAGKVAGVRGA